ncbi:Periplasmic chaperone PpiD [Buchnera aphidicola (Anoecia corni)]|uniref:Periplasmic chaperone PpiD n=1 Tax=Buchnera aphidicola (Anoecia corni) TaxID=2994477 RepID=A0AAT9IGV4_9GAMM
MNKIIVNSLLTLLAISLMISITYTCVNKNSIKKEHTSNVYSIQKKDNTLKYIYQLISSEKNTISNNLLNNFYYKKNNSINQNYRKFLSKKIKNILLEQYMNKIHFLLSSSFIKKKIQTLSFFKKNNKFNQNKFNNFLKILHISKKEYENFVNIQESKKKFLSVLEDTDFLTNSELNILIKSFSEHRIIRQAKINVYKKINQQKITLQNIKNYYKKHKYSFFHPEKLKINYIKLDINKLKMSVNNNNLKNWNTSNCQNPFISTKRKFTILKTNSKKTAKTIITELLFGKNFKKIEKQRKKTTNYIPITENNSTSWITNSSFPSEIQRVFLAYNGNISKIICSKQGFYILKSSKVIPSQKKTVLNAKKIFTPKSTDNINNQKFQIIKQKIYQEIKNKKNNLKNIAKKFKLDVLHATLFSKKNTLKNLINTILEKKTFKKLNIHSISNVNLYKIDFKHGICYLFNIEKYIPKKQKTISECIKEIKNILRYTQTRKKIIMNLKKTIDTTPNNKLRILLNKQFVFSNKIILSQLNISPLQKFSFNLKLKLQNQPVYGIFTNPKGHIFLIECNNTFYSNSSNKKNILFLKNYIENYYSHICVHNIFHSLEQTSDIKNNTQLSGNIV